MRLTLVALTALATAAIAGCADAGSPTTAATADDADLQAAYDAAWQVSNRIEEWSNFVVDGEAADRPTEAEWERTFERITEVIRTLCAVDEVECQYPGQGY